MSLPLLLTFFFFNDTATTEIYTLSLHDALPIFVPPWPYRHSLRVRIQDVPRRVGYPPKQWQRSPIRQGPREIDRRRQRRAQASSARKDWGGRAQSLCGTHQLPHYSVAISCV